MTTTCDTSFAHAVRLAATGIRPKSGVDVAVEAGPLSAVLDGDRALDQHGLDLLALAVTGKLRKARTQPKGETMFAHAVRRASAAWRAGKHAHPSTTGAPLAEMLRSGQPLLGAGERQELAGLFSPKIPSEHNARKGRTPIGAGHSKVVAVAEKLQSKMAKGAAHKNAVVDTAEEFGISPRTVESYEAMTKEREVVIKSAQARWKKTTK